MRMTCLLPLIALSLSGCVDVHEHPAPQPAATVVSPAPAPATTYVTPAPPPNSTTIVRSP